VIHRLRRIAGMSPEERRSRLASKWMLWGPRGMALKVSWYLDRRVKRRYNLPYVGRADVGPRNLQVKLARAAAGGPFEQPAIQLVNLAAVGFVPESCRVLEIGGGTGYFAVSAARLRDATIVCSEFDDATREWATTNRPHPNVTYGTLTLEAATPGSFDVVVALDVLEHVTAYGALLARMARVAPMAILSTPNKLRDPFSAIRTVPDYDEHVLEWTAGEFYWVLRAFWKTVELWTIRAFAKQTQRFVAGEIDPPVVSRAGMWEFDAPLIAVCSDPRH
jgi:2-polyprenyl-3-methyl-5-hydroxy-6-metoxy-1,4-benzoquinol methylase